jgi:hypothetical protein
VAEIEASTRTKLKRGYSTAWFIELHGTYSAGHHDAPFGEYASRLHPDKVEWLGNTAATAAPAQANGSAANPAAPAPAATNPPRGDSTSQPEPPTLPGRPGDSLRALRDLLLRYSMAVGQNERNRQSRPEPTDEQKLKSEREGWVSDPEAAKQGRRLTFTTEFRPFVEKWSEYRDELLIGRDGPLASDLEKTVNTIGAAIVDYADFNDQARAYRLVQLLLGAGQRFWDLAVKLDARTAARSIGDTASPSAQRDQIGRLFGSAMPAFFPACGIAQLGINPESMTGDQFVWNVRAVGDRMKDATRIIEAIDGIPNGVAAKFLNVAAKTALMTMLKFADEVLLRAKVARSAVGGGIGTAEERPGESPTIRSYRSTMADPQPDPVAWRDATAKEMRGNVFASILPPGMTVWPKVDEDELLAKVQNEFDAAMGADDKAPAPAPTVPTGEPSKLTYNDIAADVAMCNKLDKGFKDNASRWTATPCSDEAWRESLSVIEEAITLLREEIGRLRREGKDGSDLPTLVRLIRQAGTLANEAILRATSRGLDAGDLVVFHRRLYEGGPLKTHGTAKAGVDICGDGSPFMADLSAAERWVKRERGALELGIVAAPVQTLAIKSTAAAPMLSNNEAVVLLALEDFNCMVKRYELAAAVKQSTATVSPCLRHLLSLGYINRKGQTAGILPKGREALASMDKKKIRRILDDR